MMLTHALKNSASAVALAGAILFLPVVSKAQPPYGAPTPDQYAAQNPQYAQPSAQDNQGGPGIQGSPQDQQAGGYPMQNGAPSGVEQAPPPVPDYDQPPSPGDGYIWTPGYWAWGADGYEWTPGAWVEAPYTGALWTPGYWGYYDTGYLWYPGYWGPTVGYYGGINYGFGYFGIGFYGGYWGGGRFWYNRCYSNIGFGRGFNVYNRPFNGFSARPGGASFARVNSVGGGRFQGSAYAGNRGSGINGNRTASYAQASNRSVSGNVGNSSGRYYGGGYSAGASRSYAQPSAQSRPSGGGNYRPAASGGGGAVAHAAPSGGGGGSRGGGGGGHR
jgi:hypothetical protein